MKKIVLSGLMSAMILGSSTAMAVTGTTAVTLEFPNLIILHYFSSLTLQFTATADIAVDEGSKTLSAPLSDSATGTVAFDAAINPSSTNGVADNFTVLIQNAWVVRGVTASGTITVSGTLDTGTATNGTSTATATNLLIQGANSGGPVASYQFTAPGFSLAGELGDVMFDLDITQVTTAGAHTGIQYTISATTP